MSIIYRATIAIVSTSFLFVSQFVSANENITNVHRNAAIKSEEQLHLNETFGIKIQNLSVKYGPVIAPMDVEVEWDDHKLNTNNYKDAVKNGYLWNGYIDVGGVYHNTKNFLVNYPLSQTVEEINKDLIHFLMKKYPFTSLTIKLIMHPTSADPFPRFSLISASRKKR